MEIGGEEITIAPSIDKQSNILDLMTALQASIEGISLSNKEEKKNTKKRSSKTESTKKESVS